MNKLSIHLRGKSGGFFIKIDKFHKNHLHNYAENSTIHSIFGYIGIYANGNSY